MYLVEILISKSTDKKKWSWQHFLILMMFGGYWFYAYKLQSSHDVNQVNAAIESHGLARATSQTYQLPSAHGC